jgi:hypothetical protein
MNTKVVQERGKLSKTRWAIYLLLLLLLLYAAVHELAPEALVRIGLAAPKPAPTASASPAKQEATEAVNSTNPTTQDSPVDQVKNDSDQSFYSPLHIGVLFDISLSHSKDRFENAKRAVRAFLESLKGQSGDVSIIAFGTRARVVDTVRLAESEKASNVVAAFKPTDRYTDHLAAFVLGESNVIARASTDGGRAILLMATDREVSPPPNTIPPKTSFEEVITLAGLPYMQKSLKLHSTILDFGGTSQQVKAEIGAVSVITAPDSPEEAVLLGRKLAAQTKDLPSMISGAGKQGNAGSVSALPAGGGWLPLLGFFLSGAAATLALVRGAAAVRSRRARARERAKVRQQRHRLIEVDTKKLTRIYLISSDESTCRSRYLDIPSPGTPPNDVWISSPSFIVPGINGRVARLQTRADAKLLLRTTDFTEPIRLNGESVRPNATYAVDVGSRLAVGRIEFKVSDENPGRNGTRYFTPQIEPETRAATSFFTTPGGA